MQVALNIDTIDIQNPEIVNFIQNKSTDEIKKLFVDFLTKQIKTTPSKQLHKWAEFGEKMNGRISQKSTDELIGSRE